MKIAILDRKALGLDLDLSVYDKLGTVTVYDNTEPFNAVEHIGDADCIVINKVKMTKEILEKVPNLKIISEAATGYDNIDTEYCRQSGIAVCNVPAYSTNSVAQITVSLALMMGSSLDQYTDYCRTEAYTVMGLSNYISIPFHEFNGRTWGIIGYGNIGRKVGTIAEALGCRVIEYSRTPKEGVENVSLDTLFEESDIISIHCPLTPETKGLIGWNEYAKMKKHPLLINVARGAVLDDDATVDAALTGKIGGFAADVFDTEPMPADHPFGKIKHRLNVYLTPHMAWASVEARTLLINEMAKNVEAFIRGEKRNRVV